MNKRLGIYLPLVIAIFSLTSISLWAEDLRLKNSTAGGRSCTHTIVVEMGPYDLRRKYKIMEGPCACVTFRVGNAVDKTIIVPKSAVRFVENEKAAPPPAKPVSSTSSSASVKPAAAGEKPKLTKAMNLYWFTGARVDAIDENGQVLPKPIYLCHGRLDVFAGLHRRFFPDSTPAPNGRICLFTQGRNSVFFPPGYGVPIAGREKMRVDLKALNLSSSQAKQIKLRCTIYLAKDRELRQPMSALNWQITDVLVKLPGGGGTTGGAAGSKQTRSGAACRSLCCLSTGEDAPNNVTHWREKDAAGNLLTGHWVVPPGRHVYSAPITAPKNAGFALSGPIRAAWAHVHPYCRTLSLVEDLNGKRRNVFTIHCRTTTTSGARLADIELINAPAGLPLNKKADYFLTATYDNTSGKPQDSMAIAGIFFSDLKFKKPAWALPVATYSMPVKNSRFN